MNIRGSAFLWHQVRCMAAVLFFVGQGLESPCVSIFSLFLKLPFVFSNSKVNYTIELGTKIPLCHLFGLFTFGSSFILVQVVDSLLDITRTPRKPQYTMAPELPLILRSCLFDRVSFMCLSGMSLKIWCLTLYLPGSILSLEILLYYDLLTSYLHSLLGELYDFPAASSILIILWI